MANYKIGEPVRDRRYSDRDFLGRSIEEMPYTPNIGWKPPTYHPVPLDELIAVHLTDQDVRDGALKPHSYSPAVEDGEQWFFPRETLSFTLNGVVADHTGGDMRERSYSWKGKRYAYLIPLRDIIDQVTCVFTHDTVVLGKIFLPDSTTVIAHQNRDTVMDEVSRRGYHPFDIQGVKGLDPAYLSGTDTNVNHQLNFSEIFRVYGVDRPYTSPSPNNILALDDLLRRVFLHAVYSDALLMPIDRLAAEMQRRMAHLRQRYYSDSSKANSISRLEDGVAVYQRFLSDLREWEQAAATARMRAGQLSEDEYALMRESVRAAPRKIRERLLWKNNEARFSR
ncbi:MAG: hypothetical protein HYY37_06825 [Candidatus Aenigmarchaeota archaeon]|nr:hypothetical protein [Candidatus Aenigmarchaeota archaeon]